MRRLVAIPIIVATLAAGGFVMSDASAGNDAAVVTLNIYSGRPNPTWTLSPESTRELVEKVEALPATDTLPARPDGLGYRGLTVNLARPPMRIVVGGGSVARTSGGATTNLADTNRAFERWLLDTGAKSGAASAVENARKQLR
jgi:hypothetical protein